MSILDFIYKRLSNVKFANKLLLAFLITSSIPILFLGIYAYQQVNMNITGKEKQNLKEQIWQKNETLNSRVVQFQTILTSLLYNPQITQCINTEDISIYQQYLMFSNILEPTIDSIVSSHADIFQIKIHTSNRTLEGHSKYLYSFDTFSQYPESSLFREKRYPVFSIRDNHLVVISSFPDNGEDRLTHVLYIEFRINDILYPMTANGQLLSLSDKDGRVLYNNGIPDSMLVTTESFDELVLNGIPYIAYKNEISESEWTSICLIPLDSMTSDDNSILYVTVALLLVTVLLSFSMIFLFSRWLLKPLKLLLKNIKKIEKGDFSVRIASRQQDEMGELTNTFCAMVERLDILVNEVYVSKINLKEAEFKMLQAQINPHFLYNTMSYINWSALKADVPKIAKISRDLSTFYRTALNKGDAITSLETELLNARSYINIQLALHDNSFDVEYDIFPGILHYKVVSSILQPVIENAIEHGIDQKKAGRGILKVSATLDKKLLYLCIADNGPGFQMNNSHLATRHEPSEYGLKNINDRIRIYYGKEYGIEVKETNDFTQVSICLPAE